MKKILMLCAAALALTMVGCKKDNNEIDWSKVTVDGFYVAGPATGSDEIRSECVMAAGFNEVDKAPREGMYEKYIVLEAGKDFFLLYNDGGNKSRYSASLASFETPEEEAYKDNPPSVMKGKLISGDDAPAMRVEKTGLYHIVLDINKLGDLDKVGGAQILLLDASDFGVRGAMNGWGFTSADPAVTNFSNDGIAFTFKDQKLGKNGEFKFATGNYWKVTLDDAGKVKAEVSLAAGMTLNGDNISVDKSGKYDITLNFKLAGGSFDKSFSYTTNMTEALPDYPDYIEIRGNYNNHEWGADKLKLGAKQGEAGSGVYKAIVTMMGGTEFKFVVDGGTYYGGSFTDLTTSGANMKLDEEGTYYVEVDIKSDTKTAKFEKVTRVGVIGNALTTGWDSDQELSFDAAKNVFSGDIEFLAGSDVSFKIRFNNAWDWSYGGAVDALVFDGANFPTPGAGTYNVVADFANTANLTLTKK